jgi:small nuclear ribonucleoprotein (snRNP)-like protein
MKFSMRVVVAVLLTACVMMWAGSAWADQVDEVVDAINNYGSKGLKAVVNGKTISVTGNETNVVKTLNLGDISGLTIEWNATLTCSNGEALVGTINSNSNAMNLILMSASSAEGVFNIKSGTISLANGRDPSPESYNSSWPRMIKSENVHVIVDGGRMELALVEGCAISNEGKITINGGTVHAPYGEALGATTIELNDISGLTGLVFFEKEDGNIDKVDLYDKYIACTEDSAQVGGDPDEWDGVIMTVKSGAEWKVDVPIDVSSVFSIVIEPGGSIVVPENKKFELKGVLRTSTAAAGNGVLKNSGTFTVHSTGKIDNEGTVINDGTIDIYGTVTNLDEVVNNGKINNYSSNTLNNRGTLTNNGDINNTSDGKITNSGIIANTDTGTITNKGNVENSDEGSIVNKGTIDNTGGTIKSDSAIDGVITGNDVQPLDKGNGGSSGCNGGYGLFGLLLTGLAARKSLKK